MTLTKRVLGIETSCDETAAAVVAGRFGAGATTADDGPPMSKIRSGQIVSTHIQSNVIASQFEAHAAYGGVVPEIAARAHVEKCDTVVQAAMSQAQASFADLDAIAVTAGPGLIGGVLVGLMTAKALAMAAGKPLIGVNHLEGHALTPRLTHQIDYPYLLLLVSGGHTQLVHVAQFGDYTRLGTTLDDAVGEAFDKTAKLLGLGQPGGPAVQTAAETGDPTRFTLPKPLLGRAGFDFSFAGLKTAVRRAAEKASPLSAQDVADLSASFQATIAAILTKRVASAVAAIRWPDRARVVAAGGVAANREIRAGLTQLSEDMAFDLCLPPPPLCTDNAAMIAWAGLEHLAVGRSDPLTLAARARWPLDERASPRIGAGRLGAKA